MEITFWGVRGCIPSPGPEYNRYGGNTPCVAVTTDGGHLIILDAGTGIIGLGQQLMKREFASGQGKATLLLTHAHWDHIQGFPFCPPVYIPGNRFTIYGASGSSNILEGSLEGQMNPHFSPVQSLRNLGAQIDFCEASTDKPTTIFDAEISACFNPHGHISALAFRIDANGKSVVYAPDTGYSSDGPSAEIKRLYNNVDLLIHDTTYTPEDYRERKSRGYCSIDVAARVAAESRVRTLAMFHYDQDYSDNDVDALRSRCRGFLDSHQHGKSVKLIAAAEGLTLAL